jgi:hypothetical protein
VGHVDEALGEDQADLGGRGGEQLGRLFAEVGVQVADDLLILRV